MPEWLVYVLAFLPLEAFAVFVLLLPFVSYLMRMGYERMCLSSKDFISSPVFGLVTYLCGNIGSGKTTCASGIANTLSLVKSEQACSRMQEIIGIFPDVDFNGINASIRSAFLDSHILNTNLILNFILDGNPDLDRRISGHYYDNGLYPVSMVSLLRDYIDAFVSVLRNNYVYFLNRGFYCWTTDSWAMPFDYSMIDIKDRHIDLDYSILRYTTIFEDEKVLSGKVSTNSRNVAKEDGGGDTFFRLIRHFGKGTIHYLSTSQDFGRVVKSERELATGIFYIRKRRELACISFRYLFSSFLSDLLTRYQCLYFGFAQLLYSYRCSRAERLLSCFPEADSVHLRRWEDEMERYSLDPSVLASRLRRLLGRLASWKNKDFADGFVSYRGTYYTCASDVGKTKESAVGQVFDVDLVFPLCWCYGSVDTYSFSIVHDVLVNESDSHAYDDIDFSSDGIPCMDDDAFDRFVDSVVSKNDAKLRRSSSRRNSGDGDLPYS